MPCFLHYITVLIENSMLLSEYGRFLTAIFYSVGSSILYPVLGMDGHFKQK